MYCWVACTRLGVIWVRGPAERCCSQPQILRAWDGLFSQAELCCRGPRARLSFLLTSLRSQLPVAVAAESIQGYCLLALSLSNCSVVNTSRFSYVLPVDAVAIQACSSRSPQLSAVYAVGVSTCLPKHVMLIAKPSPCAAIQVDCVIRYQYLYAFHPAIVLHVSRCIMCLLVDRFTPRLSSAVSPIRDMRLRLFSLDIFLGTTQIDEKRDKTRTKFAMPVVFHAGLNTIWTLLPPPLLFGIPHLLHLKHFRDVVCKNVILRLWVSSLRNGSCRWVMIFMGRLVLCVWVWESSSIALVDSIAWRGGILLSFKFVTLSLFLIFLACCTGSFISYHFAFVSIH